MRFWYFEFCTTINSRTFYFNLKQLAINNDIQLESFHINPKYAILTFD